MKRILAFSLWIAAGIFVSAAGGQELHQVSADDAAQHIIKRVEPRYPSLAETARIQGLVIVRVTVDQQGSVSEAKAVSGHPLLIEAAVPAVKAWKFAPFTDNGNPVPVSSLVSVMFSLGPGADRQRYYLRQEADCNKEVQSGNYPAGEAVCVKALKTATELPKGYEADKMRAYGNAGTVAFELKKRPEALKYFQQQLEFARQALKPGSRQMIRIRSNLVHTYLANEQFPEADAEYTELEKAMEAAEADLGVHRASYAHGMQVILQEHATLLRKMGKTAEADALEQRAGSRTESK